MALRGNLKDFSLPDVFQLVTFSRKTGVLRIERLDGALGSVWFRDGDVFFAQSNWHTEPLGERLVRAQRLTPQALDRALQLRRGEGEGGRRLGTILIDEGYITDAVLETFVSEQIQETIFDLMRWDEGEFDFEAMPEVVEEDIGLSVSIENVIMEGSRRLEEWTRIKKKIPSVDVVFKMATAPGEGTFEISLKPTEWNLLLLVDGTRSVAELAHDTNRTDFEVARIIYGLFSAGLLEFAADDEVERLRAERHAREIRLEAIEAQRKAAEESAAREAALAAEAAAKAEAEAAAEAAAKAAAAEKAEAAAAAEARAAAEADAEAAAKAEAAAEGTRAEAERSAAAVAEVPPTTTEPAAPAEVPEFLGGMSAAPTADDAAVLREMMGAVLQVPQADETPDEAPEAVPVVPTAAPVEPHVPAEDPAFMAVEHMDTPDLTMMPVPSIDELLTDLADLRGPSADSAEATANVVAAAFEAEEPQDVVVEPGTVDAVPISSFMDDVGQTLAALGVTADAAADESVALPAEAPELTDIAETVVVDDTYVPEPVVEPASLVPPTPAAPAVEPVLEFLQVPGVEDLGTHEGAPRPPVAEYVSAPGPEPEPEPEAEPEPEPATSETTELPVVRDDFERDLMSLGLGELPADLFGDSQSTPGDDDSTLTYAWVEAPPVAPIAVEAPESAEDAGPDFSELLESLDVEPEPVAILPDDSLIPIVVPVEEFDEELLREVAPVETGGVISTDAFLDDISIGEMDFSGGLTDELSALTGADRPSRPTTNVNKISDPSSGEILHRDARVDKDTLLKIIDGIKNL